MTKHAVFVCKYGLRVSVLSAPVHSLLTHELLDKIAESIIDIKWPFKRINPTETRPLVENKVVANYKNIIKSPNYWPFVRGTLTSDWWFPVTKASDAENVPTSWLRCDLPSIFHYDDVIMTTLAYQITSLTVVYSIVYSGVDERKQQSSVSLAFVRGILRDQWIPRTNGQ